MHPKGDDDEENSMLFEVGSEKGTLKKRKQKPTVGMILGELHISREGGEEIVVGGGLL
jgi:hypothetical protein